MPGKLGVPTGYYCCIIPGFLVGIFQRMPASSGVCAIAAFAELHGITREKDHNFAFNAFRCPTTIRADKLIRRDTSRGQRCQTLHAIAADGTFHAHFCFRSKLQFQRPGIGGRGACNGHSCLSVTQTLVRISTCSSHRRQNNMSYFRSVNRRLLRLLRLRKKQG